MLSASTINFEAVWPPQLLPSPEDLRFDISASWEDIMALSAKARGELAEARLVVKLMELGVVVAKPFGENAKWDLVVQAGRKLSRLQLKSAWVKSETGYHIASGPAGDYPKAPRRCYRPSEIDFVVGYAAPEDAWFIFPVRLVRKSDMVLKTDPKWRLARFRDRWDLLF